MAIADYRLTASRYVRPGAYIGFVRIPRPTAPTGDPRLPSFVGRGNRLALVKDLGHRRSFTEDEELTFTPVPPYRAQLDHNALNDKQQALLLKSNGEPVNRQDWTFLESIPGSGDFDQVEITITKFDGTTTYVIDYQSVDRDVLDELRFADLRSMINVGDTEGQPKYIEFIDYRIVTQVLGNLGTDDDALIPGATNTNTTGLASPPVRTSGAGGTMVLNAASAYTHPYNMHYKLTAGNVGGGNVTFDIEITALSGGNDQVLNVPAHSSFIIADPVDTGSISDSVSSFALDQFYPWTDGILLDLGTGFADGDTWEWDGLAPAMIEISSAHDNANQFSTVSAPVETATTPASSGEITLNQDTDFTGLFDRDYHFEVTAVTPASTPGTTFDRTATIIATGYNELPYTERTYTVDESVLTSNTNVSLEQGIFLDFNFGVGHKLADAANAISAADATELVSAVVLAIEAKSDFNAHDADAGATWHFVSGGSHQVTAADPLPADNPDVQVAALLTLVADLRTQYGAHLADSDMHVPIDDVFGLDTSITTTDLASTIAFLNDFKANYERHRQAVNFTVGDTFIFTALAARQEYTSKDDRTYLLTTTTIVGGTSISFAFQSGTIEGGFGNVAATPAIPYLQFQDNITLSVRNYEDTGTNRHAVNDTWNYSTLNTDRVDWTLTTRVTETISSENIRLDQLGQITGIPLAFYVILDNTPDTVIRVREVATGNPVSFGIVQTGGDNTPYLVFLTDPGVDIEIFYEHRGAEPDPGNFYFITAHRLRSAAEYNTPILFITREQMTDGLSPRTPDNHLYIAGDIAFDTEFFGAFFIQVLDAAGDGVFTLPDFRAAIDSTETTARITDLIVLSFFDALGISKRSIEDMNDPFQAKERILWVGAPIGTPIGDVDTPNTLIFLSRKTLQFSGDNPGRGNVILIGNTEATRSIVLDDGTTTVVTLDGSFIAVAAAARTASFQDPAETILKKDVASFDSMVTFNEKEETLLGAASITYLSDVGGGLFRFQESLTVDTASPDLNEISAITQKHFVTKFVRTRLNENLIALVPPSPSAGVVSIQGFLAETLASLASAGLIASYGSEDDPPTTRKINPSSDTYVYVDKNDRRLYHFGYFFNIRFPIKRLFGLFSVDGKFWDSRSLAA